LLCWVWRGRSAYFPAFIVPNLRCPPATQIPRDRRSPQILPGVCAARAPLGAQFNTQEAARIFQTKHKEFSRPQNALAFQKRERYKVNIPVILLSAIAYREKRPSRAGVPSCRRLAGSGVNVCPGARQFSAARARLAGAIWPFRSDKSSRSSLPAQQPRCPVFRPR
jgi:hypothetical protein